MNLLISIVAKIYTEIDESRRKAQLYAKIKLMAKINKFIKP